MKKLALLTSAVGLLVFFLNAQQVPQLTRGGSGSGGTQFVEGGTVVNFNITTSSITYLTVVTQTVQTITYSVGNGGRLTIQTNITILTNGTFTLSNLPPNTILKIGANQILTNIANSSGVLSNDGSGGFSWVSVSSGGSGVTTIVTPLTYSGTNIVGFNCLTNNATYTLLLTNHCLFDASTFTELPNTTTNMFFTLGLKQDSAGGWVPKLTNSIIAWSDGTGGGQPVIKTNANAVSYLYFHTHLFTNGMLVGSPNLNIQ